MSSSNNDEGSSANNPINLLSSSPETQRAFPTARAASDESDDSLRVRSTPTLVNRPLVRPKRESDSGGDDTDSDLGYRRTRAFRGGNRDRSSSSRHQQAKSVSSSARQVVGTSSNPIILGESPTSKPAQLPQQQDHEPGPARSRDPAIEAELWGRHSSNVFANNINNNPNPAHSLSNRRPSQIMSRPAQSLGTSSRPTAAGLPTVPLPRWQPDAEVTYCPICHTQFSFFIRKHHCRKCGRVVCDACSPHRITIPYQYIVQPPGTPVRMSGGEYPASLIAGEGGYADFSGLGGGERVRLCNPCVPDPNIAPPQAAQAQQQDPALAAHSRSQSSVNQLPLPNQSPLINRLSAYMGAYNQTPDQFARSRSVTMVNHSTPASPAQQPPSYTSQRPIRPGGRAPASARPFQGLTAESYSSSAVPTTGSSVPGSSSSRINPNRALPAVPQQAPHHHQPQRQHRHQIPEEDECPVCHRELPPRTLPDFEARRESHITYCIVSHSSGAPTRGTGVPPPSGAAGSGGGAGSVPGPSSMLPPRRTGMFPYKATEKDCVDSAECSICLEEFEVGIEMARLECLCRFHRRCINAWFERHPGQCPMHQHDGFGF